ncbi:ABC transporter permease [Bacillus sp. FJAT-42376]|uniref:FtsX-like permease family protein n=1 Tax=Bacillus sp. FJAT-42376 TaxID=2014076 RepID=UPI000F512471|nr:ABC transporter permease [Bacillus sp. FJAT-42376]AZB41048.1 ABC transporter permease [Bacillus sp. FJAT-42376]
MSVNQLIIRNLKKNLKNYYLYVFALIFSAALYFAFVTLQYDPSMDETKGSIKGAASIGTASVLLVAIVATFLLYANNLFIKRRSREIGLFQLIGMTKSKIFRILSAENFILYFGSLIIGIFVGFMFSRLIMMVLFKITGIKTVADLNFSPQALIQTIIVFSTLYLLIMLMNYIFIKRQSILSLFRVVSSAEGKVKKISAAEIIIGIAGIALIGSGYYVSSKLFDGDFKEMTELMMAMLLILASVILGTYLFYKGTVRFTLNAVRKKKNGYLSIHDVLSLSSIMFRMKSNALLLTIITTVSALSIGLLALSYISYYSAEKTSEDYVPHHFSLTSPDAAGQFKEALEDQGIAYSEVRRDVIIVNANVKDIMESSFEGATFDANSMVLSVISDESLNGRDISPKETYFTGSNDIQKKLMSLKNSGRIEWLGKKEKVPQTYLGLEDPFPVSLNFTSGALPTAVVDDTVFKRLQKDLDPALQKEFSTYIGMTIQDSSKLGKANDIFKAMKFDDDQASRLEMTKDQKIMMGLMMFIVGFLGLAFLVTSGCILYFKQMDESEDEKPNYTILRKLGFTQEDLLKGIRAKQLFNFGIPLALGLLHSYFAVQSGWFFFGTELWTPIIIVMVLYTALYSVFGILSVFYYRKVIKEAL